jgi:hypothetical protein
MRNIKKPISLLLAFTVIISVIWITPVTAKALNPQQMPLEDYIIANLENFTERIDVSHYILNSDEWFEMGQINDGQVLASLFFDSIYPEIVDNNPQLFNVNARSIGANWLKDLSLFELIPAYIMTPAQYTDGLRRFNAAAAQALNSVRHVQTDFEKALLLHNFVVLNTTYDDELFDYYERHGLNATSMRPASHTAYGSLVDGLAVCDGYAKAYSHLLRLAGIESRLISGEGRGQLHAWNLIHLGGNWYHADPTWNGGRLFGSVMYDYFLLNSREINNTHANWRLPDGLRTEATDFSNAFFRSAQSAVVVIDGYAYWLEHIEFEDHGINNNFIRRHNISTGRTDTIHSFEAIWYLDGTEFESRYRVYLSSYNGIAAYNGLLYFNTAKEIFSLNPETLAAETVYTPANLGGSGNRFIYGMMMNENVITFSVKTEPGGRDELFTTRISLAEAAEPGAFTSADAMIILRYGAGLITLTAEQMLRYDLNGDGAVNSADAIIILRKVAGIA